MKFRLDLEEDELVSLQELLKNAKPSELLVKKISTKTLLEKIAKPTEIHESEKKVRAIATATKHRSKKAQEKIANAVNILRMENKKFTHYNIAKMAEVSFNTCRKYISDEYLITLNENI